eukprot:c14532_g1_i1.p1 GENE.c14532_g1_i1~~c14532_g1_i1.p1  ORF type:complete len:312 (-),score=63.97 c14532_g1_i1:35-970(-)
MIAPGSAQAKAIAQETATEIRSKLSNPVTPRVAIVCGSGLKAIAEDVASPQVLAFSEISGFPHTSVSGHGGAFIFGNISGIDVVVMQGRLHYYEGHTMEEVTRAVRVFAELGVETLVVTNAAGAVNQSFRVGDIVLISDQIAFASLAAQSPLVGPTIGERFIDMSAAYSPRLKDLARLSAKSVIESGECPELSFQEGVYGWVGGPTYESPAEVHALRTLGVDCVAMSTAPEVLLARHCEMRCVGFSIISDECMHVASRTETEYLSTKANLPNHTEVLHQVEKAVPKFRAVLRAMLSTMAKEPERWKKDGCL